MTKVDTNNVFFNFEKNDVIDALDALNAVSPELYIDVVFNDKGEATFHAESRVSGVASFVVSADTYDFSHPEGCKVYLNKQAITNAVKSLSGDKVKFTLSTGEEAVSLESGAKMVIHPIAVQQPNVTHLIMPVRFRSQEK